MLRSRTVQEFLFSFLCGFFLSALSAFAETVELVTYYPSEAVVDNLHVESLTVGSAYAGETPPDGTALFVGPVGIGTDSPQALLDLYQQDETYLRVSGTGINAAPENFSAVELGSDLPAGGAIDRIWQIAHKRGGAGAVNDLHINYFDGAAWSTKMAFLPNSRVGIGTPNPESPLHIASNSAGGNPWIGQLLIGPSADDQAASISLRTTYGPPPDQVWTLIAGAGGGSKNFRIFDSTAGQDRLNIDANGNVGIGTNTPGAKLEVAQGNALRLGSAYLSSGLPNYAIFAYNAWYNGSAWVIPDATLRSSAVILAGPSIYFYQTQTAGGTNWVARFWIDGNGVARANQVLVQTQMDNAAIKAAIGNDMSKFVVQRDSGNGLVYLYHWDGSHKRIRLQAVVEETY